MNAPQNILSELLAAATEKFCFTEAQYRDRERALVMLPEVLDSLDPVLIDAALLDKLTGLYFLCTYAHGVEKHAVKAPIVRLIREHLRNNKINDSIFFNTKHPGKPRVLVITNFFHSAHVLYQVFGKSLIALKERFEVVGLSLDSVDAVAAQSCFHHLYQADCRSGNDYLDQLRKLQRTVSQIAPDFILYIDTAMHPFTLMLSTLRLAPLQATLFGHPAPTFSNAIDGFICPESFLSCIAGPTWQIPGFAPGQYTVPDERMEPFPDSEFAMFKPRPEPTPPAWWKLTGTVRVSIPATLHKVSWPFLNILRQLQEETNCSLHFLGSVDHTKHGELQGRLDDTLNRTGGAILHPTMLHADYMGILGSCDFFTMPFPFNGFASVQNAFVQRVPGVILTSGAGAGMEEKQAQLMNLYAGLGAATRITEKTYLDTAIEMTRKSAFNLRNSLENFYGPRQLWRELPLYQEKAPGVANAVERMMQERR